MKRSSAILTCLMLSASGASALELSGAIGPYPIEMELARSGDGLTGRYRYAGQSAWLSLSGESFGREAVQLEEKDAESVTGQFYLELSSQGLAGHWVNDESDFEVTLAPTTGDIDELLAPVAKPEVSQAFTGRYEVGSYWVNGLFAPNYEIGFNGGTANVVEVSPETIFVAFEFIVGPTYHIAYFRGPAELVEDGVYVHDAVLEGGSEPCRLVFRFDSAQLAISDTGNGFACQFGARAHANFDLVKTDDVAEFGAPW